MIDESNKIIESSIDDVLKFLKIGWIDDTIGINVEKKERGLHWKRPKIVIKKRRKGGLTTKKRKISGLMKNNLYDSW